MRFPPLKLIVDYGLYTVKELENYAKGLVGKRNVEALSECEKCDFVYKNCEKCPNCHEILHSEELHVERGEGGAK